ncbi:hypothetical protein L9F63_002153 [Diploptera punctata]|uniref:Uncharacterized protein n=1 Tax=Diploptera punctata TaxID=6984 RepID=A0AAD8A2Q9_DIPPU|nr:hypothetical protein L9F63_002153 [Diploptera punctata]
MPGLYFSFTLLLTIFVYNAQCLQNPTPIHRRRIIKKDVHVNTNDPIFESGMDNVIRDLEMLLGHQVKIEKIYDATEEKSKNGYRHFKVSFEASYVKPYQGYSVEIVSPCYASFDSHVVFDIQCGKF